MVVVSRQILSRIDQNSFATLCAYVHFMMDVQFCQISLLSAVFLEKLKCQIDTRLGIFGSRVLARI